MYTKIQFGKDLKKRVEERQPIAEIAQWAYGVYLDFDVEGFDNLLLRLDAMELGPEFFLSYKELNQIADNLILGKEVKGY